MIKAAITGASGFVGTHLTHAFEAKGWNVIGLVKGDLLNGPGALADKINGANVVVNLAGAPVIKRWTEGYKKTMYRSRVDLTHTLVEAIGVMNEKPGILVSTSAVGFYSSEGEHDEYSYNQADDFLGRMAGDWEQEALKAGEMDVRTVAFRFGIVLGRNGGALKQMLLPFRLGLGGTVGDGSQALSWVHMEDLIRAFVMAIENNSFEGVYNLCSPNPSTNWDLTRALAKALRRPAFLRVPELLLKLQYGQGAEILTKGQRVFPKRLLEAGFSFNYPDMEEAVRDCVL
jgi:uncharacterized protein (TIGR01777 family)